MAKTIDKKEMDEAVLSKNENKIYFYFSGIANTIKMDHPDIEDWRSIAVARAFNYIDSFNSEKGSSFSYFYRIIKMEILYQYRAIKTLKRHSLKTERITDNFEMEYRFIGDQELLQIGGYLIDKQVVTDLYNEIVTNPKNNYQIAKFKKEMKNWILNRKQNTVGHTNGETGGTI